MKAIILAAGFATRLYPLTENKSKILLPVGGKPILEHIIAKIDVLDAVDEIIIITNDKFYQDFVDWQKTYTSKKKLTLINDLASHNEGRLGVLGDIHFAIRKTNINDELLIIAGDNLFDLDLTKMYVQFKEKSKGKAVIGLHDLHDPQKLANRFGTAVLDDKGKLIDFEEKPEKPKSSLAATVIYFLPQSVIGFIAKLIQTEKMDNPGNFIIALMQEQEVYGFVFDEAWYDIGSKEEYEKVQEVYQ